MEILWFKSLDSTQMYLMENLRNGRLRAPVVVVSEVQKAGIGSRGNTWESVQDGLYFSLAIELFKLPEDLPLESISIYMGYLFKDVLVRHGAEVWLKWPNDLYVGEKKAGGVMCSRLLEDVIVGIGLNLQARNRHFGMVGDMVPKDKILETFVEVLECKEKKLSWKQIFSKYKLEFPRNFSHGFHYKGRLMGMDQAILCEDGAVLIGNEKIYSLR